MRCGVVAGPFQLLLLLLLLLLDRIQPDGVEL